MAKIYAELILNGYKTLDKVPARLREQVEALIKTMNGGNQDV